MEALSAEGAAEKICLVPGSWSQRQETLELGAKAHTGKSLDLLAHNIDTSIVTGVELQHHLSHILVPIDASCQSQYSGGLAGAWGTIEKKMR